MQLSCLYLKHQWPPGPVPEANHVSWALSQTLDKDFDIIHVHSALALAMSRLMANPALVYTIHHERVPDLSSLYQHFPEVHYVAISYRQKELECQLPNCEVIHHGLDVDRFQCVDLAGDYVCFVGRLAEEKGPHIAIDVAERLGSPHQTWNRLQRESSVER